MKKRNLEVNNQICTVVYKKISSKELSLITHSLLKQNIDEVINIFIYMSKKKHGNQ